MSRERARRRAPLAILAAALLGACTEIPTGAEDVFSIALRPLPSPAVVVGDTLRGEDGQPVALTAVAFNANGDAIAGAPITYFSDSTLVAVSPEGFVIAGPQVATASVYARAGGLTTEARSVQVVPRPDSLQLVAPVPDSVPYGNPGVIRSAAITARLLGAAPAPGSPAGAPVPGWIVRYAVQYRGELLAADDPRLRVVPPTGAVDVPMPVDTTDASGVAARALLLLRPGEVAAGDSAVVIISARYRGQPVDDTLRVPVRLTARE